MGQFIQLVVSLTIYPTDIIKTVSIKNLQINNYKFSGHTNVPFLLCWQRAVHGSLEDQVRNGGEEECELLGCWPGQHRHYRQDVYCSGSGKYELDSCSLFLDSVDIIYSKYLLHGKNINIRKP